MDVQLDCTSSDEVGTLSRMVQEMTQKLKASMDYINALAYRDSLTGIRNTTAYTEATAALEEEIKQPGLRFAVLVADINGLKIANDTYGHETGNQLIVRTSQIICDTFKHSPVFRIGGDEFVVLLQNRDLDHLPELTQELDEACTREFIVTNCERIPISIARGTAEYQSGTDHCYEDVFVRADQAMYLHKQQIKSQHT